MASSTAVPVAPQEKFCVVCGQGSHRTDWKNKFAVGATGYVACDSHDEKSVKQAITDAEAAKATEAANLAAATKGKPTN